MRIKSSGMCLGIVFGLVLVFNLAAKDKTPKVMNVQGQVQSMDKNSSAILVMNGNVRREVLYSGETKFLYGHSKKAKMGAPDQVKTGNFISCAGAYNDKTQLMAKECVYRETK